MDVKMLKRFNSKPMGPFGDIEIRNGEDKQDKQKKEMFKTIGKDKTSAKLNKPEKLPSQDRLRKKESSRKLEYQMIERDKRERYEIEAAEMERNIREAEFEKWEKHRSRNKTKSDGSLLRRPRKPPTGYKDPHEVCKPLLSTKVKEKKREEIKALMNCIAFTPSQTDLRRTSFENGQTSPEEKKKETTIDEMDNSSASESTSITDVTPRSSSSGCSSMSKQSVCIDKIENPKVHETESLTKTKNESKTGNNVLKKSNTSKSSDSDEEKKKVNPSEGETKNLSEIELEEMKYMQDAFENLDVDEETSEFASSIISGLSEERRAKSNRKNMTFTNEQLREIERVNLILLKKIMKHKKPNTKPLLHQPPVNRRTSASINRSRMEEKIERENKMLLKKLQSAKGTTGTLSRKSSQPNCYR